MTPEDLLARFCRAATPSEDAVSVMRLSLLDWAACGVAGADEPLARIIRDHTSSDTPDGVAHLIGGGRTAPSKAALTNGTISHALDYDDTHFAHIGHTSVAVVPAALAVAEQVGADMESLLRAALIGSEAAVRIGLWLGRGHYQIGFHQTATAGAFGATLAAAHLLQLDPTQIINALGLAATKAAGLKAQFGTMGKPLNAGLAAETGVLAAQWAKAGMTASALGLSGPLGFGETHHGAGDLEAFDDIGHTWLMLDVSHKLHACCHGLHAALEALATLPVDPAQVDRVTIVTHPRWLTVCNIPNPETGLALKFSYAMTSAMVLHGISTAQIVNFNDQMAQDPDLMATARKVVVIGDSDLTEMQAEVLLGLRDGRSLSALHDLGAVVDIDQRLLRIHHKAEMLLGKARADHLAVAMLRNDLPAFAAGLLAIGPDVTSAPEPAHP